MLASDGKTLPSQHPRYRSNCNANVMREYLPSDLVHHPPQPLMHIMFFPGPLKKRFLASASLNTFAWSYMSEGFRRKAYDDLTL